MPKKNTIEEFIKEASAIHNWFYIYDDFIYYNAKTKGIVKCPIHGKFEQTPCSHLSGVGCPKCGKLKSIEKRKKWTTASYIEEISKLHPELDFSKSTYVNPKTKIKYTCELHGEKEALPYSLLKGHGCKDCSLHGAYITKEDWIQKFKKQNDETVKYYKIPDYFLSEDKITFVCTIHGDFEQRARYKGKCPKCSAERIAKINRESPTGWRYSNWEKSGIKSKRFESFKTYIIKCWNDKEEFYKIGKTYLPLNKRFDCESKMPYKYIVLKIYEGDAMEISQLEKQLQKDNKKYKYIPCIKFQGMYECYSSLDLKYAWQ